jgi:hypothetical protein
LSRLEQGHRRRDEPDVSDETQDGGMLKPPLDGPQSGAEHDFATSKSKSDLRDWRIAMR